MALPEASITATLESEEACLTYLEQLRWPGGVACPACSNQKLSRFLAKGKSGKSRQICQCLDHDCKYQFSATTGTIFHDSHLPLSKWFEAMRLLADPEKATAVNQLRFVLGVQYKTAKNVAERIQQALRRGTIETASAAAAPPAGVSATVVGVSVAAPASASSRPSALAGQALPKPRRSAAKPAAPSKPLPVRPAAAPAEKTPHPQPPESKPTVVDSMLSVITSAMNLSVKPPLAAVNYLKKKIID